MFCNNCGTKLEDDALFCPNCGTKIEAKDIKEVKPSFNVVDDEPEEDGKTVMYGFAREEEEKAKREEEEKAKREEEEKAKREAEEKAKREEEEKAKSEVKENADSIGKFIFCHECGAKNEANAVFCNSCGKSFGQKEASIAPAKIQKKANAKKYCHNCGAENDIDDVFCNSCGMAFNAETGAKKPGKKKFKVPISIVAIIAVVGLLIVAGIFVVPQFFSGNKGGKGQLLYIKDNELTQYIPKGNIVIDDDILDYNYGLYTGYDVEYLVNYSDDGSKVFYPRNYDGSSFDLYYSKANGKVNNGEKVDSSIVAYKLIGKDTIVYIKDAADRKLYIADLKDRKDKIASNVDFFRVSEDEKTIFWKTNSTDDNKIYYIDSSLKKEKEKLDSEISSFITASNDLKKIYYTKDNSLYEINDLAEKNKVASDIENCVAKSDDNKIVIYYYKNSGDSVNVTDSYLEDDYADADAKMKEPVEEDYQHVETKDSFWGPQEETVTDDAYYQAWDKYREKEERDRFRNSLESMNYGYNNTTLYCYNGKDDPLKLSEGIVESSEYGSNAYAYLTVNNDNVEKVKLSKLMKMSYDQQEKAIKDAITKSAEYHLNILGDDIVLDVDFEEYMWNTSLSTYYDSDKKLAYIVLNDSSDSDNSYLFKTDVAKKDGALVKVCEEFGRSLVFADGKAYYLTELDKDGTGDLYADGEKIASDVNSVYKWNNDKGVIYMTDANDNNIGTIFACAGTKSEKVADDVYLVKSSESGDIAVLTDYSFNKYRGDLKLYKGGKLTTVDSDVNYIVSFE